MGIFEVKDYEEFSFGGYWIGHYNIVACICKALLLNNIAAAKPSPGVHKCHSLVQTYLVFKDFFICLLLSRL